MEKREEKVKKENRKRNYYSSKNREKNERTKRIKR